MIVLELTLIGMMMIGLLCIWGILSYRYQALQDRVHANELSVGAIKNIQHECGCGNRPKSAYIGESG